MGQFEDGLIRYILIMNAFVISWTYLVTSWMLSKKRLRKQGYPEEYIVANQSIKKKSICRFIGLYMALQAGVLAGMYFSGVTLTSKMYVSYIFPLTFIPAMIYVVSYKKKCNEVLKDAAQKSQSDIVIDFNFRALHLVLNARLEILSLVLMIYFNARYLGNISLLYFFGVLPWFNYVALKNIRFQTRETMKDQYKLIALSTIFLQVLKSYEYLQYIMEGWNLYRIYDYLLLLVLVVTLVATVALGVINFPKVRKIFDTDDDSSTAAKSVNI